mmetsp:Transcript_27531/g.39892  ORF Transcript_27531/g.39892 Transcript_27531/m.39892 type:complete len:98 (+) Transcript_27531:280-573(+)
MKIVNKKGQIQSFAHSTQQKWHYKLVHSNRGTSYHWIKMPGRYALSFSLHIPFLSGYSKQKGTTSLYDDNTFYTSTMLVFEIFHQMSGFIAASVFFE